MRPIVPAIPILLAAVLVGAAPRGPQPAHAAGSPAAALTRKLLAEAGG